MSKITPFLWYLKDAEEAVRFYASIFPDSEVVSLDTLPIESPSGPPGSVVIAAFKLFGQDFKAMGAGGGGSFNHAVSFYIDCEDQAEVDRYWNAILENGGKPEACGWIQDRYGVEWQIVPKFLTETMLGPDRQKYKHVAAAMMTMVKLDVAALKAAADAA